MGCQYKEGDYCHYTRRRCSTLNWGCYDDFNLCNYMSYEKQTAIEEKKKQKEEERKQRLEQEKRRNKEYKVKAEQELEEARQEAAANKARQEKREMELEARRERAKEAGLRIKEDVRSSKLRNQAICMAVTLILLSIFVTHVKLFSNSLSQEGAKLFFVTLLLTLPMLFFPSLGLRFYGKKAFFGKQFKGSAFLRSFLATLIPSWIGLTLAWIATKLLFKLDFSVGQTLVSYLVYLISCVPAWWFNHFSLPYIFDFNVYKE